MNYIDEIFLRCGIQQIGSFLLYGTEGNADPRPYKERVESAEKALTAALHRDYPDGKKYEEITGLICGYGGTVETVYMEIGLQAGLILAAQVCRNLKTAFEGETAEP